MLFLSLNPVRTVSNHYGNAEHLVRTHLNPFLSDTIIPMGRREIIGHEVLGGGYYGFKCPSFESLFTQGLVWDSSLKTAPFYKAVIFNGEILAEAEPGLISTDQT